MYEVKNDNVAPFLLYAGPTVPDLANPMQDCRLKKEPALRASCPPSFCYWSDKGAMALSVFQDKIFEGGCKNGVLMQYKCMEKEIRKFHGRILFPHLSCISRIFRPECSFGR